MENKARSAARTATEAIKILWQDGLFRDWKKKSAIDQALEKRGNHFTDAELGMALKRAKHLTRRGAPGNFEYIQKFPYSLELERDDENKAARERRVSKNESK